ncbi:UPF0547 protein C16orf87 homolog [Leguminivora glycinivorella]|uniref:UPF0547 protein C16orf87 homolog n=1 Tax=Leguminivora glycinivorella TaxID=1035111 RepID=UPI00200EB5D4|nr:UPF0547 protein C16orf87 homolog [Leguminivora glycinivorella]
MVKNKMIAKSCPKCYSQVAVASKSCKCGHTFFAARRAADALPAVEEMRRRTSRVCRPQPQFYDAVHYEKQKKRSPKKRSLSRSIDEEYKKEKSESATARARRRARAAGRGRARGAARRRRRGERPRDPTPLLRPAQLATCALILQEINRKMQCVTWQPQL